jgi:photosystem II stability/assembly factor-like uncharacterized protein
MRSALSSDSWHRIAIHLTKLMFVLYLPTALALSHTAMGGDARNGRPQNPPAKAAMKDVIPGIVVVKLRRSNPVTDGPLRQGADPLVSAIARSGVTSLERAFPMRAPLSDADVKGGKVDLSRIHFGTIPTTMDPVAVAAQLAALPEVEYAEPKYYSYLCDVPNDSDYAVWQQGYLDRMHVAEGWTLQKGSPNVVIATVDGGTNWQHEDLTANLWINPAEDINHNGRFDPGPPPAGDEDGVDQDGNGKVDDVIGWNFTYNSNNPRGSQSTPGSADHGTETASEFGAVTNNGRGMAGTSWNCRIMPVCAADPKVDNSILWGFEGIEYASRMGARAINCSWYRAGGSGSYQQWEQEVITAATEGGALVVAAAGNNYLQNLDDSPYYPASYQHILSVGATNASSDEIAYFTDIGLNVSVFAPGMAIRVAKDNGSYGTDQGTSHSSPLVAGLAGLLFCAHPDWKPEQVAEQIRMTSDPIDGSNPNHAGSLGHGRVNFYRALSEIHSGVTVEADTFRSPSGTKFFLEGDTVILSVKVKNVLTKAAENLSFDVSVDAGLLPIGSILAPTRLDVDATDSLFCRFRVDARSQKRNAKVRIHWSANGNEQDAHIFETTVYAGEGYWERQLSPVLSELDYVQAVSSKVVWAIGWQYGSTKSVVLRTTDGGDNWAVMSSPPLYWVQCMCATDSLHAWVNGAPTLDFTGHIYATDDGGKSWKVQAYPDPQAYYFSGFWFFDAANGYALGYPQSGGKYVILRTTDRGASWTHIANEPVGPVGDNQFPSFNAFCCTDKEHIWFGTADAHLWRSTNGGDTWSDTVLGTSSVNALAMRDNSVGLLTAGRDFAGQPLIFLRTSDGGASWEGLPQVVPENGPVAFSSGSTNAWVGGFHSIAYSRDLGATWTQQPAEDFSTWVYSISFSDPSHGWAVTDQGEILRYHDRSGATTAVPERREQLPGQVLLEQNYPNPFNPSTTIRYDLPQRSHVTIRVYNTLGQTLAELINGDIDAGYHEVTFDASGFASGMYFYRLQVHAMDLARSRARDFVQTKKLLLLR